MSKDSKEPLVLSGRVFVTKSLTEILPSRALPSGKRTLQVGDIKLWSHLTQGATTAGAGIFRAAVYNGKKWCTFRLNRVAGEHSRYENYDDRKRKLSPCVDDLVRLKGLTVCWIENSYGVYRFEEPEASVARTGQEAPVGVHKEPPVSRKRRGATGDDRQLKLF